VASRTQPLRSAGAALSGRSSARCHRTDRRARSTPRTDTSSATTQNMSSQAARAAGTGSVNSFAPVSIEKTSRWSAQPATKRAAPAAAATGAGPSTDCVQVLIRGSASMRRGTASPAAAPARTADMMMLIATEDERTRL